MATYKDGPLGSFSGKLGPVVGSTWRDLQIMRSVPKKSTKPPSQAQRLQQQKLTVSMQFLTPIRPLLKMTFRQSLSDKKGFETAKSYHMREALQSTYTGWSVIYPKVLISNGTLRGLTNPTITVEPSHILHLLWTDDSGQAMANANDRLLMVMYIPQLQQFEVFEAVANRADAQVDIAYPHYYQGTEAYCWATFGTFYGGKFAVSTYLGMFLL